MAAEGSEDVRLKLTPNRYTPELTSHLHRTKCATFSNYAELCTFEYAWSTKATDFRFKAQEPS